MLVTLLGDEVRGDELCGAASRTTALDEKRLSALHGKRRSATGACFSRKGVASGGGSATLLRIEGSTLAMADCDVAIAVLTQRPRTRRAYARRRWGPPAPSARPVRADARYPLSEALGMRMAGPPNPGGPATLAN